MAISHTDLLFIETCCQKPSRVCDIGDQDLICDDAKIIVFGVSPYGRPELGTKARDYWTAAGTDYVALDVQGDCYRFDLNTDSVPDDWPLFDLVMNAGTTEHVMNQVNCFTVIHQLCRVGGVMYHQLPIGGYAAHGLINYNVKFFQALAAYNGYEILKSRIDFAPQNANPFPDPRMQCPDSSIRIAMRKRRDRPFRIPLDHVPAPTIRERIIHRLKSVLSP